MSFQHQSYPGGRSHRAPDGPSFTLLPLHHQPILAPRMAAPTASQYGYPYMTPQFNPMSSVNPSQSSPAAVAAYSRLTTGQFLQQSIPPNNPTEQEEFTGSITVMVPALLVLVVIGINGETIRTIQKNSGAIRIHIHDPPHGVDLGDMVIPRKCQIWGTKGATAAAKREIEKIVSSNRTSPLDSGSIHRMLTLFRTKSSGS